MDIKEQIDNLILSIEDDAAEEELAKYLEAYEAWDGQWRLEDLKLPCGEREMRN